MQAHFIEGRKIARRQDGLRWIDTYKVCPALLLT